jgi:hypothetical protein
MKKAAIVLMVLALSLLIAGCSFAPSPESAIGGGTPVPGQEGGAQPSGGAGAGAQGTADNGTDFVSNQDVDVGSAY